jgi:hypothetical protein
MNGMRLRRLVITIILMISITLNAVPVNAATDKYDKLTQQFAAALEKHGTEIGYFKANKTKLMAIINKVFREVHDLNDGEWKAFSNGVIRSAEEGYFFDKKFKSETIARNFYNYGWGDLLEYWRLKDNNTWINDPDKDYSNEVISVLTDSLKKTKAEGYTVSDETIQTLPAKCAEKINSLDLAPQELQYMLYKLRSCILFRDDL